MGTVPGDGNSHVGRCRLYARPGAPLQMTNPREPSGFRFDEVIVGRSGSSGQPQGVEPARQARVAGAPHHDRDVAVAVEHGPAAQGDQELGRRLDAASQEERALRAPIALRLRPCGSATTPPRMASGRRR
jgi:hypothetical protein